MCRLMSASPLGRNSIHGVRGLSVGVAAAPEHTPTAPKNARLPSLSPSNVLSVFFMLSSVLA